MSDYLARRIERHEKIDVIRHVEVDAVEGDRTPMGLRLRKLREGGTLELDCSAVFVFIVAQPRTGWLPPSIAVDAKGFILTGADAGVLRPLAIDEPRAMHGRDNVPWRLRCGRRPEQHDEAGGIRRRRSGAGGHLRTGCSRSFNGRVVRGGGEGVERLLVFFFFF